MGLDAVSKYSQGTGKFTTESQEEKDRKLIEKLKKSWPPGYEQCALLTHPEQLAQARKKVEETENRKPRGWPGTLPFQARRK